MNSFQLNFDFQKNISPKVLEETICFEIIMNKCILEFCSVSVLLQFQYQQSKQMISLLNVFKINKERIDKDVNVIRTSLKTISTITQYYFIANLEITVACCATATQCIFLHFPHTESDAYLELYQTYTITIFIKKPTSSLLPLAKCEFIPLNNDLTSMNNFQNQLLKFSKYLIQTFICQKR